MIASCGFVGLVLSYAAANDRPFGYSRFPFEGRSTPRATDTYFSRSQAAESEEAAAEADAATGRMPERYVRGNGSPQSAAAQGAAAPAAAARRATVPNYHEELFGSDTKAAGRGFSGSGLMQAAHEQEATDGDVAVDSHGAKKDSQLIHAEYERGNGASERGFIQQVGGASPRSQSAGLIHAEYERHNGAPEREHIQQIRGTAAPSRAARSGLIHAEYERKDGSLERGRIQQVRTTQANEAADEPAAAPQPVDIPALPQVQESPVGAPLTISAPPAPRADLTISPTLSGNEAAANGDQTPQVTVQWVKKSDINVGQECQCDLVVKNAGKVSARDIAVDAYFPPSVRLTSAEPHPIDKQDHLSWEIKELAAGEEISIHLSMVPSKRGELATTAFVRFTGSASNVFQVEEPLLAVAAKGPKEVMVGDPASQAITVTNPGTGVAHNVSIEAIIPEGLEHARGEKLVMDVGSLNPGESRTVRLALAAISGGEHAIHVRAKADGGLQQEFTNYINVIAPNVQVAIDGPSLRYMGRNAVYVLTVANDGRADSNNVRVLHRVPEGFKFLRADKGGQYDDATRTISWFVGHLEAGEKMQLKTELTASQIGSFLHCVGAVAENGSRCESELETQVEGTASLVLEIVDLDDPVEVGTETAYEVRVRNDGTIPAQNVGISCELPAGVELLGAKGPTDYRAENGLMLFKSLDQLDPGKTAIYRVHVRGRVEGSHRFRARLASESIREPLIFEELTKFYGE